MASKYEYVIGIDPDVDKNGVAFLDVAKRSFVWLKTLDFFETYSEISKLLQMLTGKRAAVVMEAGWLNKSNWHVAKAQNKYMAAAIGRSAGRNHQAGQCLVNMAEHSRWPIELQRPLRKIWQGNDRKITRNELFEITGYNGRSNQESRDAALLAWVFADIPVRIKTK